jgi:hypothetical protein
MHSRSRGGAMVARAEWMQAMDTRLGTRGDVRQRRRGLAWPANSIVPPVVVGVLGMQAHEVAALKSALLAMDGQLLVPARFGDIAEAHIVLASRSVVRDGRFNAPIRGRQVIVYRHEADAPARDDDLVINAPIRSAPLLAALNAAFDRLGAAIRSDYGPRRPAADSDGEHAAQSGTLAHALQRIFAAPHQHDAHVRVIGFGTLSILTHRGRYLVDFPMSRLREAMRSRRFVISGNCDDARRQRDLALRPLIELRWVAALEGHDPAHPTLPPRFRLTRWPDFGQLPHENAHLTLTALLAGQTLDLERATQLCGADMASVAAFLDACQACGYLAAVDVDAKRSILDRPAATPGLLSRLLRSFSGS